MALCACFRDILDASVHGVYSLGKDMAFGWNSVRSVAFSGLHGLPVFHLYGVLYHRRSVLLHPTSSSLPHVENRTKGTLISFSVYSHILRMCFRWKASVCYTRELCIQIGEQRCKFMGFHEIRITVIAENEYWCRMYAKVTCLHAVTTGHRRANWISLVIV